MPHPWRHSRPGWMWLWAAWSGGWQPCTQQGVETGLSLWSFATQAILWLHDSMKSYLSCLSWKPHQSPLSSQAMLARHKRKRFSNSLLHIRHTACKLDKTSKGSKNVCRVYIVSCRAPSMALSRWGNSKEKGNGKWVSMEHRLSWEFASGLVQLEETSSSYHGLIAVQSHSCSFHSLLIKVKFVP